MAIPHSLSSLDKLMQAPDFNMISLGPGTATDDCSRKKSRLASSWETLQELALSWFRSCGLQLVVLESRSCYQRIWLGRKKRWDTAGLVFEELLASMPQLIFPRNCSETLSCTLSIEALKTERPWMAPADIELFCQAWLQSARWSARRGRECGRCDLDSRDTPETVVLCLCCGAPLFADTGWKKTFEIRCHCGAWNVLCSSIQPHSYIPPSSLDKPSGPIRKHNGCQRCNRPSPPLS
jgi:hypothetical protein